MKSFNETLEIAEKVEKVLDENNVWASVSPHYELPVIEIEINNGDWKHDHLRTKWVMGEQFPEFVYVGEVVTEEDGTDSYSAIHRYIVA